jgi:hypothetical protein
MHSLALFLLQDSSNSDAAAAGIGLAMMAFIAIFAIIAVIAVIIPLWFICKKAGFSPYLSLLVLVPLGSLILLYILAFGEWKTAPAPYQAGYQPPPYRG